MTGVDDAVARARKEQELLELLEWVREHGGARRALDILMDFEAVLNAADKPKEPGGPRYD